MSRAFMYRMPAGIPGDVTRPSNSTIEPAVLDANKAFAAFGVPGKIVAEKFVPVEAGDDAAAIYGILVRPYPTTASQDGLGVSTPAKAGIGDVLRRGYMSVLLRAGTSAKGGAVHIRIGAPTPEKPLGGIEATADGANTIVLPSATFMGVADASGNVEISYKI